MSYAPPYASKGGGSGDRTNSPLFERMGAEEELLQCRQIIDALQNRVRDLERINLDLEYRLEDSAKQCMATEKECVAVEMKWKDKTKELEKDIVTWKRTCADQELKTSKLREHLSRTEKELYGILQRKYELMRGPGRGGPGHGGGPAGGSVGRGGEPRDSKGGGGDAVGFSLGNSGPRGRGTHDYGPNSSRAKSGEGGPGGDNGDTRGGALFPDDPFSIREARAPQEIRQRRMMVSLYDFLGI